MQAKFKFNHTTRKPVGFMQSCCPCGRCVDDIQTGTQANTCLSWPILCSTTPSIMRMLSTCCLHMSSAHVIHTCRPHMSSAHVIHACRLRVHIIRTHHLHAHIIHMHTCHPHIICSTPHGQRGPKLSFYSDRSWLLNGICHKNVELFHFRIM